MISDDEVMLLYEELRKTSHPLVREAQQVCDVFNGTIALPVPEIDKLDTPAVANLTFQGVDAMGQQIGSQLPFNLFPLFADNSTARENVRKKKGAVDYWWVESNLPIKLTQLGRWFAAYGATGVLVKPGTKKDCPQYIPLDPLRTYPSGYDVCCDFAITTRRQSRRWVRREYPDSSYRLETPGAKPNDIIELIEYVDDAEFVVLARTTPDMMQQSYVGQQFLNVVRLDGFPNIAGMCPVFMGGRPGLTGPKSLFAGVLGMYIQRAMLQAYNLIGVRKSVLPEKWAVSGDVNQTPVIVEMADAMLGQIGIVAGGHIEQMLPQPSPLVAQTEDRLERGERVQARLPAEWGGESASNVRTDRRGQSIFSATIDLPVKEAHDLFQRLLMEANKAAIAIDKAYYGGQTRTFFYTAGGLEKKTDYDSNTLWDTDRHQVIYSQPGADTNGLAIEIGQRLGMGTLSHREAMEIDPFVRDAERTHDLVLYEKLEDALLQGVAARSAQGAIPEVDVARIMQRVKSDQDELPDAIVKQQQEAQQRQAAQTPPEAPAAQPGMAEPGAGAEAGAGAIPPGIPPPPQDMGNLGSLLRDLRLRNPVQPAAVAPSAPQ